MLEGAFAQVDLVVTPTLTIFPPHLEDADDLLVRAARSRSTWPACRRPSLPVPGGPFPASIQLIGPAHGEERLLAAAASSRPPWRPPESAGSCPG